MLAAEALFRSKSTGKRAQANEDEDMSGTDELERWNERFGAEGYHFGTAPNAFLRAQAARLRPGLAALCVADGEGRNSVWLAEQGLQVRAFDFSPVALDKARRLASEHGVAVDYRVCDINDWDWDERQYDVIAAIFIQFATPAERAHLFAGLCRALKPGGLLLMQGYTPEQLAYDTGGPRVAEQLYTAGLLKSAFAALEVLELREHVSEIDEGRGHAGPSALIDFVARRPA
jgi:2-polyprenyl-3-methyl-5-hydroxy-6-metoxy-1,4-benzoquinol methylase